MTVIYDVPPELLIFRLKEYLKNEIKIESPAWCEYVKTGVHKERAPTQNDWWWIRSASIMRKLYFQSPIGISKLAAEYGGKKNNGSAPSHTAKASRSIISEIFKQLEEKGLVTKYKNRGRILTPAGVKIINNLSHQVLSELSKENPELKKYM